MPERKVKFTASLLHPKHLLSWLGLLVFFVVSLLPQKVRHWLGGLIGSYLYRNNEKRRDVTRTNLRQAFPELSEDELERMTKSHLGWYGKALVDYSLYFFGSKQRLGSLVQVVGDELLSELREQKKPIVLLLAHSAMLEFAVIALSQKYSSFGSYKASSNPVQDWIIARSRCRFADFIVSREEGLRPLIRAIKNQRIMIFLPDEDLGLESGVFAPFFGRLKATLTTPARLTQLGGAKAVAGFVSFNDKSGKYELLLESMPQAYPSGDQVDDATSLNQVMETLIRRSPEQYLWVMKCYKTIAPEDDRLY